MDIKKWHLIYKLLLKSIKTEVKFEESRSSFVVNIVLADVQGPVLLTLLRHVARILANGRAAFFESCDAIGWNSCDVSQKR